MISNKKKIFFIIVIILLILGFFILPKLVSSLEWKMAVEAAGSYPYQTGLTGAVIIQCTPSCCSAAGCRCCTGGTLCTTIPDEANCVLHSDVNGMSAGGTGQPPLLLSNIAIGMAGLMSGGQLIYGGTTNSMYISSNAILASGGGCYGCLAKSDGPLDKFVKIVDFIIAGIKGN